MLLLFLGGPTPFMAKASIIARKLTLKTILNPLIKLSNLFSKLLLIMHDSANITGPFKERKREPRKVEEIFLTFLLK